MNTTTTPDVSRWSPAGARPPVTISDEPRVAAFVAAHNLEPWVEAAVRLARELFPDATGVSLSMFGAPGEYGECVFVDVVTSAGGAELSRQYGDYMKRWLAATPAAVSDLMGISTRPE